MFWIDGHTVESFLSGLLSIGKALNLSKDGMSPDAFRQELKKWLASDESGNWLVIVNNLTHTDDYTLKIMTGEKGTLLVSTCLEGISRTLRAYQLHCDNMTAEQARTTFHKYSSLDIDDKSLDESEIIQIIKLLDHSPLAIAIGASFISMTETSITEYLEACQMSLKKRDKPLQNLALSFKPNNRLTPAIMTAWDISFHRVKRVSPSAADLLQLMSILDYQNVPKDLLDSKATN